MVTVAVSRMSEQQRDKKERLLTEVESRTQGSRPRTKKIRSQGQEQPYRGQTLSRPRTKMLEPKDQGRQRK